MNAGTWGALGWLAAVIIAAAALGAWRKRRAGSPPAAGAVKTPVPGSAHPPSAATPGPGRQPPLVRPAPAPGYSLCGWYPAWRPDLRLWVERYERCPAHTSRERQP